MTLKRISVAALAVWISATALALHGYVSWGAQTVAGPGGVPCILLDGGIPVRSDPIFRCSPGQSSCANGQTLQVTACIDAVTPNAVFLGAQLEGATNPAASADAGPWAAYPNTSQSWSQGDAGQSCVMWLQIQGVVAPSTSVQLTSVSADGGLLCADFSSF